MQESSSDIPVVPPGSESIEGKERLEAFWTAPLEWTWVKRVEFNTLEWDELSDTAIEMGRTRLYREGDSVIAEPKYLNVWKQEGGQ